MFVLEFVVAPMVVDIVDGPVEEPAKDVNRLC